ncbi:MAG: hypothetical protein ACOCUT_04160, partial [bacterium]
MNADRLRFIEAWAKEIRTNPNWKSQHKAFINAQINRANSVYARLVQTPNGIEKLVRATNCSRAFAE